MLWLESPSKVPNRMTALLLWLESPSKVPNRMTALLLWLESPSKAPNGMTPPPPIFAVKFFLLLDAFTHSYVCVCT